MSRSYGDSGNSRFCKIFMKRMAKAKGRKDYEWIERIRENKPFYNLDHIVKERYPTLLDALRDLDDAVSMCFLYAMFGKSKSLPSEMIDLSRRLTLEFMNYIIETKSLRKVFISIKGYYYEANIMGQNIRWIVPHRFVMKKVPNVDFQVMKTFTEFYITLIGFVNFKLYTASSFHYPPKFSEKNCDSIKSDDQKSNHKDEDDDDDESDDLIAALNKPLLQLDSISSAQDHAKIDDFTRVEDEEEEMKFGCSIHSFHQLTKFQNLFNGLKFFINREVPREALCFIIRSFSGEVSWDRNLFVGSTFDENDTSITHQIVDREISNRFMNRFYIQPQWIFDCVNYRKILPEQNYFVGARLPPHLSPFVEEKPGEYVPPEKLSTDHLFSSTTISDKVKAKDDEDFDDEEMRDLNDDENKNEDGEAETNDPSKKMIVKRGKNTRIDKLKQRMQQENEEKRLRTMMMSKKRMKLYQKIIKSSKQKDSELKKMEKKRQEFEQLQQKQHRKKKELEW
ncbi:hypothetical protein SSS_04915 [Sarcoptes scabiei]|nr:hypothetical protein SSS_04915 [Sarcoptes scabiei]